MDKEETGNELPKTSWYISLDWFQQNNRSISALLQTHLCPGCNKKLSEKGEVASAEAMLAAIRDCCSHDPNFINERLPIMESVFRLFLSNGNQPVELNELGKQLSEWRGGDPYRTTPETLLRLLANDQYYGLREIQD